VKPVNLIPQDQRRRRPSDSQGKGAPIVLGVLAALLVMVVGYVLTANTITDRDAKAAAASAEADQLEARAGKESGYSDFAQIASTRTKSVSDVAATRFDWERFQRELGHILIGCTPHQSDVARMMVRLKQLYRVEDVQLNESTAGTADQEVGLDSCGHLYTFNLTVKFSATLPSRQAPPGNSSVPASLGGGS